MKNLFLILLLLVMFVPIVQATDPNCSEEVIATGCDPNGQNCTELVKITCTYCVASCSCDCYVSVVYDTRPVISPSLSEAVAVVDSNCGPVFFEIRGGELYSCQYCWEEPGFAYKKCNPLGPVVGDPLTPQLIDATPIILATAERGSVFRL